MDDMVNRGMVTSVDAVEKFDPDKGNKFRPLQSQQSKGSHYRFYAAGRVPEVSVVFQSCTGRKIW